MEENGFSAAEFEQVFDLLKDKEGILKYSRSAPRGYSIQTVETAVAELEAASVDTNPPVITKVKSPIVEKITPLEEKTDLALPNEAFLNLVKQNQPVSSKAKLLELAETMNLDKNLAENLIDQLKELGLLTYSKSAPRGWSTN
jgi:predicted HTH transcriptional regulator